MRVLIQRVSEASVTTADGYKAEIDTGLLVLVGLEHRDQEEDVAWLTQKIVALRIFDDENGVMNRSLQDIQGKLLVISQFTLHARTKKGNRPSYIEAAPPDKSVPLYNTFVEKLKEMTDNRVVTGIFGAQMQVSLINDGPVTIFIDTHNKE
jgi:D-aminoacyl-tRNA deacylase